MRLNEEQLIAYGEQLGATLGGGSVVALTGDLGAGKTTLAKAIATGLGVVEPVTSPTFTIANEYLSGRLPFYHLDVYRLGEAAGQGADARLTARGLGDIGYETYILGAGVTVVEWADMIADAIPENAIWVRIDFADESDFRDVDVSGAETDRAFARTVAQTNENHAPEFLNIENLRVSETELESRNLLAIETTGAICSVALRTEDGRVFYRASAEGLMHLTSLLPMIAELVRDAGLTPKALGCVAVSAGPGSFTGIRIGVATVRALAQSLDIPVIKVPTLETFVYLAPEEPYIVASPIFDARRAQMYAGAYMLEPDGRIMTLVRGGAYDPEDYFASLASSLRALKKLAARASGADARIVCRLTGDGIPAFRARAERFQTEIGTEALGISVRIDETRVSTLQDARAVLAWALAQGRTTDYETLEPIYMRKAEAQRRLDEQNDACSSPFNIRQATESDVYGMSVIERLSFGEPWLEQSILSDLKLEYSDYVVCEADGVTLGYAGVYRIVGEGHITNIAVHPSVRGRGVGSATLGELIRRSETLGVSSFTLEVRDGDAATIRFYEKQGFVSEGARKDYYPTANGGREDARIMWRRAASNGL